MTPTPAGSARGRTDRPSAGWWLLDELALGVTCPAWCVETPGDGPVCLYHAAQAVEDGALDPADLTVAAAPDRRETAEEAR